MAFESFCAGGPRWPLPLLCGRGAMAFAPFARAGCDGLLPLLPGRGAMAFAPFVRAGRDGLCPLLCGRGAMAFAPLCAGEVRWPLPLLCRRGAMAFAPLMRGRGSIRSLQSCETKRAPRYGMLFLALIYLLSLGVGNSGPVRYRFNYSKYFSTFSTTNPTSNGIDSHSMERMRFSPATKPSASYVWSFCNALDA